jgi:transcriptional regulator NrdR family protein
MALECPECAYPKSGVKDSRPGPRWIKRRRICFACSHRFNTWECHDKPEAPDKPEVVYRERKVNASAMGKRLNRIKELCDEVRVTDHPMTQGMRLFMIETICEEIRDL